MKVLLANSPFGGGGITTFATELVACLSEDTELTVVLGDDKKAPITNPRVKVIYHDTMSLTVNNALYFIDLINNVVKPDVVLVSAALIIPIIVPYINDNIKILTVGHSGRFLFTDYSVFNHQYLDRIIAASSSYNKKYLERRFKIKDINKIKVIYNFVARDEKFENLRLNKPEQSPISIVYAGASSVHKSPELVAQIATELLKTDLDFRFFWTGNPTIPLTTNILKHTKFKDVRQMMPQDPRLIFPGRIPSKEEYDLLLGSANIFLAPSKNEGCSMATLEAHRTGCILLVADYENSNREIVEAGKSGFVVEHNDVGGFVNVISDIVKNPTSYAAYYENSHETFIRLLSYPVWRKNIFDAINSELSHRPRKTRISRLSIQVDILRMKLLKFSGTMEQLFEFTIPSYLSFRKQYKLYKKNNKEEQKPTV